MAKQKPPEPTAVFTSILGASVSKDMADFWIHGGHADGTDLIVQIPSDQVYTLTRGIEDAMAGARARTGQVGIYITGPATALAATSVVPQAAGPQLMLMDNRRVATVYELTRGTVATLVEQLREALRNWSKGDKPEAGWQRDAAGEITASSLTEFATATPKDGDNLGAIRLSAEVGSVQAVVTPAQIDDMIRALGTLKEEIAARRARPN